MKFGGNVFSIVVGIFQIVLLILFAVSVDYGKYIQDPKSSDNNSAQNFYPFFQDVNVMIFIGFGFLMTFLKKYSFGSVGYNLFIACVIIQWATLINGWITNLFNKEKSPGKLTVDLKSMILSDFAAAAVLITFGAVLGKVSRLQLFVIGVVEVIFYAINENILIHYLHITDVGGSMVIHMFGAYFGLAVAKAISTEAHEEENQNEGSVYHSDVFAMIGTVFLWMFWPSFNGAMLGPGPQQQRAIINTYYSLGACCVVTFVVSPLVHKKYKLDMVHIQNATLAGGVAVGTCADLIIKPWGAILIGMCAGVISTLGYAYMTPFMQSKLKIHDTCGVHNLHGMPAILAAIAGAIASSTATFETYGQELYNIWGSRAPVFNSTEYKTLISQGIKLDTTGSGRSSGEQGGMQAAAMFITIALSLVGGTITGLIARYLDAPDQHQLFDDRDYWIVPSECEEAMENGQQLAEKKPLTAEENC